MVGSIVEQIKSQLEIHQNSNHKGLVVCDTSADIDKLIEELKKTIATEQLDKITFLTKKQMKKCDELYFSFATIWHKEFIELYHRAKSRIRV